MNVELIIKALDAAVQLAEIASDWNLDEVEIDGEMVSTVGLHDQFEAALVEATGIYPVGDWEFAHAPEPEEPPPDPPDDWDEDDDEDKPHYDTPGGW